MDKSNEGPELTVVPPTGRGAALAERPDDELMTLVRREHSAAMEVLFRRHEARVVGFACKYLGDRALAEEACQETFVRLWRLRDSYDGRGTFGSYICKLCLNVCRELTRKRTRKARALSRLSDDPSPPEMGLEESLLAQEQEKEIEVAISKLPPVHREALLLRFYSGLSYTEMVQVVGRSEGTLRSRVHHGLKKLQEYLQEKRP